ncbi:MAG: YaiI/YqxD family protein [Proteobacteria bacterium]|nr:YaiI/YqxD family protein [Pseudomonadota bacterium]
MAIWIDADACPKVIRDIICRAAERTGIQTTFIANQAIPLPPFPNLKSVQVRQGFDVADDEIARRTQAGDLIVTQDIPLANEVIEKGAVALSPRGELFTASNIKARLNMRDFMDTMRASGVQTGGPPALSQSDRKNFAHHLDRYLAKQNR